MKHENRLPSTQTSDLPGAKPAGVTHWKGLGVLALATTLFSGCSVYNAYTKCGFKGCEGDAAITAEVTGKLRQRPDIDFANSINVQTLDGVVYLYGMSWDPAGAASLASQTSGVKRVVNSVAPAYSGE
jgi:osmotically-inducible protein OsmY